MTTGEGSWGRIAVSMRVFVTVWVWMKKWRQKKKKNVECEWRIVMLNNTVHWWQRMAEQEKIPLFWLRALVVLCWQSNIRTHLLLTASHFRTGKEHVSLVQYQWNQMGSIGKSLLLWSRMEWWSAFVMHWYVQWTHSNGSWNNSVSLTVLCSSQCGSLWKERNKTRD